MKNFNFGRTVLAPLISAAVLVLPIMLAAAWVLLPNGGLFSAKNGGWEYPVFLAIASLALALWLLGDGAYALRRGAWLAPRLVRA